MWELGIGLVVSDAQNFCQPEWHGFDVRANVSDMFALSMFAQALEDFVNSKMEEEARESGNEFTPTRGKHWNMRLGMTQAVASDLPSPYRDCVASSTRDDENPFYNAEGNPLLIMMLAAQTLASADAAAEHIVAGRGLEAMQRFELAALSLAEASRFAGHQEAARFERMAEAKNRAKRAAQGGMARAERYAATKKWVLERYLERTWPSDRQAALSIYEGAYSYSVAIDQKISEDRAFNTVYDWIRRARDEKPE
ncbi:hypothetical protein BX592_11398 [Paraburkholderia rhizosphaerae]|uniref:Uncharacterized protein n=2 Tax=Paraburkholderia rhizosphaerae TaxID=480658 RepID=A0A4R8LMA2_9BURK|nr:hypothetical protein BX592_11398 [Paraburkholderia rhizosphaerae]